MENLERFIGEYYIYDKMPKEQVLEICAKILEHRLYLRGDDPDETYFRWVV